MTTDKDEQVRRILSDPILFAANCLKIVNKKSETVPFVINRPQKLYVQRASKRNIILKARKMGLSSWIIAKRLWECAFKKNRHHVLLTHSDPAAEKMFKERIIPLLKSSIVPIRYETTGKKLYFPETKSWFDTATAGSKKFGRGDDLTSGHLSEVPHWESPEVITAIEGACVDDAELDIETTANGDNFFKPMWEAAKDGKSNYKAIFLPWYCDEEYSRPDLVAQLGPISEEEHKLMEAFKLTTAQIAWRRNYIRGMSQPELFPQEFPATDMEAFLTSGRMVFDWRSVLFHEQQCTEPRMKGAIRDDGEKAVFEPNEHGRLSIWRTPEPNHVYVIGGDVAEGLKDGAYSVGHVLDATTDEEVAVWHGHIAPDLFAEILVNLARYYNNALLAPEAWPGPGAVTMSHIVQLGYQNIYKDPNSERLGWETNLKTKPMMIHAYAAAVRDMHVKVMCKELVSEIRGIIYNEKGDIVASRGVFSDRVIGASIAWFVSRQIPSTKRSGPRLSLRAALTGLKESGYTSVPKFTGPRLGVRPKESD